DDGVFLGPATHWKRRFQRRLEVQHNLHSGRCTVSKIEMPCKMRFLGFVPNSTRVVCLLFDGEGGEECLAVYDFRRNQIVSRDLKSRLSGSVGPTGVTTDAVFVP